MALSTLDTLPQVREVVLDEHKISPETSAALSSTAFTAVELDEATRAFCLAMEHSPEESHDGIGDHASPHMLSRDDQTGMYR